MKNVDGKRWFSAVFAGAVLVLPLGVSGQEHHRHHPASAAAAAASGSENPLIEEMIKLDAVFREVVSGVALSDGARVHQALETMHGTMEKTHEGADRGTVRLRKNADRMKEFMALDKKFHEKIEALGAAAQVNDRRAMLRLAKELLDGCVRCHEEFRQP